MHWEDRLFAWVTSFLKTHPAIDHAIEMRAHALGMHGPSLRHALRTHFDAILILTVAIGVSLILLAHAIRTRRVRGGGRKAARTHPLGHAAPTRD